MRLIGIYLRGVCMGAADAVPGVSGGTIALITGIYDRLVGAIAAADPRLALDLVRGYDPDRRAAAIEGLRAMDVTFLLALGLGVISAVVTVARVIEVALEQYSVLTFAFFFGLIAASAIALADDVDLDRAPGIIAGAAGVVLAVAVTSLPAAALPSTLPVVLLAGLVAISAMVLPGISGSLILLLLGQYEYLLGRLNAFVDGIVGLAGGGNLSAVTEPGVPVVVFMSGAIVGLLSIARAVQWALEAERRVTITFLVGLMVGALRLPIDEVLGGVKIWTPDRAVGVLLVALVGAVIVLAFDRYAGIDY